MIVQVRVLVRAAGWLQVPFRNAVTGESPEYFAEYKIRRLRQIVACEQVEVSRICDFGSGIGNSIPFFRKHFPDALRDVLPGGVFRYRRRADWPK